MRGLTRALNQITAVVGKDVDSLYEELECSRVLLETERSNRIVIDSDPLTSFERKFQSCILTE